MNIIGRTRLLCVLFVYLYFLCFMSDISCFIFIQSIYVYHFFEKMIEQVRYILFCVFHDTIRYLLVFGIMLVSLIILFKFS